MNTMVLVTTLLNWRRMGMVIEFHAETTYVGLGFWEYKQGSGWAGRESGGGGVEGGNTLVNEIFVA